MTARGTKIGWGVAASLLVATSASWLAFGHAWVGARSQPPQAASGHGVRVRVHVVRPQQGGVPWTVTRPASVRAFKYADLYAKVSGYLQNQAVDIGDAVKKGQLLADLFAPEILAGMQKAQADVRKAEAMVDVAQARVEESKADLLEAQAKLEQTQADLQSAQSLLKLRQQQYDRIAALAKLNAIQEELVDEKFQARRAAEAAELSSVKAVATAQAGVAAARAQVTRSNADLANARAEVQVAQASLAQATALEEYTKIRSPYTGVVTARNFHDGDFIRDAATGASQPVLSVAETDLMRVIVWIPDQDVPSTRRGSPAVLHFDALDGREFKGRVARTAMAEDYNSRTMRTEIDVPNTDGSLTEGMFGSATIDLEKSASGVNIPSACLLGDEKEHQREVYVVREGHARKVAVRVGHNDGIHAQILSGLKVEDEVIAGHGSGLEEGVPVEVVASEIEPKVKEASDGRTTYEPPIAMAAESSA